MASTNGDPNAAPTHLEVRERFASWQVMVCAALGTIALAAGVVLGIVLQND